jgi:hypothetical protein
MNGSLPDGMQCQICLRLHSGGWTLISKPTGTTAVEASTNMSRLRRRNGGQHYPRLEAEEGGTEEDTIVS